MNTRICLLALTFLAVTPAGIGLAEPPAPPPARVRPTLDIAGTHVTEMALYFTTPSEAYDTGITVSGFREDGCGFVAEVSSRVVRGTTTVVTLGVHATTICTPENRNQDTAFTVFLGALEAGHYEVRLGSLVLPFDVAAFVRIPDAWAVRLAVVLQYQQIGVHACGMPPYPRDGNLFPEDLAAFKRDHADVWARALQIATVNYPPAPEEEAARLVATGRQLEVSARPDGTWHFSFTSSSCCSSTTTSGIARIDGKKVVLPADSALEHQTVTRPGCRESDFPV